jgi:hypothetical protein
VEQPKFDQTNLELIDEFAATRVDTTLAFGKRMYEGAVFEDRLQRVIMDIPGVEPAHAFLAKYKETLKARFEQVDIWISAHEIDILWRLRGLILRALRCSASPSCSTR